jgi:hypothetical protein
MGRESCSSQAVVVMDSGLDASHRPGMTDGGIPGSRFARPGMTDGGICGLDASHRPGMTDGAGLRAGAVWRCPAMAKLPVVDAERMPS